MEPRRTARTLTITGVLMTFLLLLLAGAGCQFGGGGGSGGTPPSLEGDLSVWYVAPSGDDLVNTCHTQASPCRTVQFAIDHAYNGAIVHLAEGTYNERITIPSKGIRLQGAGAATILTNSTKEAIGGVIQIECPGCYSLVTISDMTIQGGSADQGGGIHAADVELTLNEVVFWSNQAEDEGGGLYIAANSTAKLNQVTFNTCQATGASSDGGAVFNAGTLMMEHSTLEANNAEGSGGGLYTSGQATVLTSTFINNSTYGFGGGIHAYGLADGLYMGGSEKFVLRDSTFSNNQALMGGGMANNGMYSNVTDSTFDHNNAASAGGGLVNMNGARLDISNVTFSANSASYGGAIANGGFDANFIGASLTIAYNQANQAGGYYQAGGGHNIINSIFAYNEGGNCSSGPLTGGIILSSDASCNFTGSYNTADLDPLLGPLQDNGGHTWTHALLAGSPAIDSGTNWLCPQTDQRGIPRGLDGNGDGIGQDDVGAFEFAMQLMSGDPDAPVVFNTPGPGRFTFLQGGNCRSGPATVYPVVTSAAAGAVAQVQGRNEDASWYALDLAGSLCWVSARIGTFDGDPFTLPQRAAPPSPTPTDVPADGPTDVPDAVVVCSLYTSQDACEAKSACKWVPYTSVAGGTCQPR